MIPRILITPGEPAGIGPDLLLQIAQEPCPAELVAVCDPNLLRARALQLGLAIALDDAELDQPAEVHEPGSLRILPVTMPAASVAGQPDPANALYVLDTLKLATQTCMQKKAQALVTGPVQKSLINDAGIAFTGHTEFLADLTHTHTPVMMLVADQLRVALATTHLPLRQVPAAITARLLKRVIYVLNTDLRDRFGCPHPRILVCGLNPHAGEGGHLGREELDVMIPAIEEIRESGIDAVGPLPADTLFTAKHLQGADAVLAMYHDQGLPVLKHAGFGDAVNVTLGLPIIRTSVDHGTALDLAGTGKADDGSLRAALDMAVELAQRVA
ncbi:MAG TPA: 4-hydroxythreonine-4-phosphate dehydrogenase PdxA [Nevskiaceae bacterium]|nr:4-hydroxythreonine-4-phosphate dehydrogenase PdxA [Nevskiaceae bacterium]